MSQSKLVAVVMSAALICTSTVPTYAADCDIKGAVTRWTQNKRALANIRMSLKDLGKRLVTEGGPGGDYSDAEFGGAAAKESFAEREKGRQAEYSVAVLLLAGRNTTCYVCPVKQFYQVASDAGKACSDLIQKAQKRPGFEKVGSFNCENVRLFSRFDLTEPKLGSEFWEDVRFRQRHLNESLDQQPNSYEGDAVVSDSISRLKQQLEPFVKVHMQDPDRDQFVKDVRETGCPGYEAYITGTENW